MLHILLPVHDRAAVTSRFLAALVAQDSRGYHLWVIDDGCTDDTVARVTATIPAGQVDILRGDGSLWWAGSLQLGYEQLAKLPLTNLDAVLICNDDMEFEPDFLRQGLAVLAGHPGAAIQAEGHDAASGAVDHGAHADLVRLTFRDAASGNQANCLSTRGLLMSGAVFVASGGFRPKWLPHYLSDYEFTLRLRRQGVTLLTDPRFHARVRLELTGHSGYNRSGPRRCWQSALSNRSKNNPKHWTAFVLMACPVWVAPLHLARIWTRFALALLVSCLPSRTGLSS